MTLSGLYSMTCTARALRSRKVPFAVSSRENPQPLQPDGTLGTGKTLQPDGTLATEKSLLPDETLGTRKALQPDETLGTGKSRQPNTTVGTGECHGADDALGKNGDQQAQKVTRPFGRAGSSCSCRVPTVPWSLLRWRWHLALSGAASTQRRSWYLRALKQRRAFRR